MLTSKMIYHNSLQAWTIAIIVFVICFVGLRLIKRILFGQIDKMAVKTATPWDDLAAELINRLNIIFFLAIAFFVAAWFLELPSHVKTVVTNTFIVISILQVSILISHSIEFWLEKFKQQKLQTNAGVVTSMAALAFLIKIMVWALFILLALANLGVNITALVAGLGVSGIAVALAVQNILGDLFASYSIVIDKPFVIGDFVIVGDFMGTIEKVGLKTTRIRSLSGEQLIFSNTDLLQSRIRNYKRMLERRVVFSVGVIYQTEREKIEKIPRTIKQIILDQEKIRFDRAHFKEFGPYSLNFEVVYWVLDPDYAIYMDIQQAINLAIMNAFEKDGIQFAYPTQMMYVQGT